MLEHITFDDVLIKPKFSKVVSRKDVNLSVQLKLNYVKSIYDMFLPIMSANMDTITGVDMAQTMHQLGGIGVLHRFCQIADNVSMYKDTTLNGRECAVAVGVGEQEQQRAKALYDAGARIFILDVAHGAQQQVVDQYKWLKENLIDIFCVVGNFASGESCGAFWAALNDGGIRYYTKGKGDNKEHIVYGVDAFKVGVGPGSACTTRIKTGVGVPQLSAIMDVANYFKKHVHKPLIIADGGMKTPGDIAKALAAGADMVMLGGMLAGTHETPGEVLYQGQKVSTWELPYAYPIGSYKKYRGSASKEAYIDQGKDASYRTAEGESFTVPYKGPVAQVLQDIEGGLRSAFTYVGAKNIKEFQEKAEFVKISTNSVKENGAHGK